MVKRIKEPVDNSAFLEHTEYPARDKVYNWIVMRYGEKGNPWKKSDTLVFYGFIYHLWDFIPSLLFIYFTYWIVNYSYVHYGWFKAITVLAVMFLFRVNALLRVQRQTNRLLKGT